MPREPLTLPRDQQRFVARYRAALPGPRRAHFDRALQDSLRGEPAPEALAAAVARAFLRAKASPAIAAIFKKEPIP
jgi:hypothetical protein